MDPRLEKMAGVLVSYSTDVQPGDWVSIRAPIAGKELALACTKAVLGAGGKPSNIFTSEETHEAVLRLGNDDQIAFISPGLQLEIEQCDKLIFLRAPTNSKTLDSVPSDRIAIERKAWGPLQEHYMKRTADRTLKWTIAQCPTFSAAQDAGMSLAEYEDFVFSAGLLGEIDPVAAWRDFAQYENRIRDWLADKHELRVLAPGTDLRAGFAGRRWLTDDGHLNFPGGEVFTGPLEDSVDGDIAFTFPGFYSGKEVPGIKLRFEGGRVVDASATSNESFLHEVLQVDEGAKRVGEMAIGLNPGIQRFSKNTLFDEKIGGTMHFALGHSIPMTGGVNQSDVHWDIVLDLRNGGEIYVDGLPFSRDGKILI